MALYLNNDLEYVVDDSLDMDGFNEQRNGEVYDVDTWKHRDDTFAAEFRKGKDIQGIPWERMNHSREVYRGIRLKLYKNYESLAMPREELEKECKKVEKESTFYDFQFNTKLVKPTIVHFQLRNLLWATSKHDVYMTQNYSLMHWSSVLRRSKEIVNVAGQVVPTQKGCDFSVQPVSRVQISTMAVKGRLLVAGGFQGELVCKNLDHTGVAFCTKASPDNSINNAVDIYQTPSGSLRVAAGSNDCNVRMYDTSNFTLVNCFTFPWSVNCTAASPDGKLLAVLGDDTDCLLADSQSGKVIGSLKGHLDYSFASDWHPNGYILATGNQDTTCRLWDIRNMSGSLAILKGRMGAIRGIKFSTDGRFMAMAEPADFVHVYDVKADYSKAQEIDMFGEIAGVSFSPDAEALFIGVADRTYGSLIEFKRRHQFGYLDSLL